MSPLRGFEVISCPVQSFHMIFYYSCMWFLIATVFYIWNTYISCSSCSYAIKVKYKRKQCIKRVYYISTWVQVHHFLVYNKAVTQPIYYLLYISVNGLQWTLWHITRQWLCTVWRGHLVGWSQEFQIYDRSKVYFRNIEVSWNVFRQAVTVTSLC